LRLPEPFLMGFLLTEPTFLIAIKNVLMLDMVSHTYNPSSWEAEAGGLQVQGQPGQLSETLTQK
jgi:hypothetical protein